MNVYIKFIIGYDAKKISEDANQKLEQIKSTLKLEGLTTNMKEWFEANKEKASKTLKVIMINCLL